MKNTQNSTRKYILKNIKNSGISISKNVKNSKFKAILPVLI